MKLEVVEKGGGGRVGLGHPKLGNVVQDTRLCLLGQWEGPGGGKGDSDYSCLLRKVILASEWHTGSLERALQEEGVAGNLRSSWQRK